MYDETQLETSATLPWRLMIRMKGGGKDTRHVKELEGRALPTAEHDENGAGIRSLALGVPVEFAEQLGNQSIPVRLIFPASLPCCHFLLDQAPGVQAPRSPSKCR